jgi:hypothetical protein
MPDKSFFAKDTMPCFAQSLFNLGFHFYRNYYLQRHTLLIQGHLLAYLFALCQKKVVWQNVGYLNCHRLNIGQILCELAASESSEWKQWPRIANEP